ncbi:MAG TPA: biotin carboxylase, partial [Flavobacteriales bacterium]|nr:biotin carboxylase [Flavobacteriales bacterium]
MAKKKTTSRRQSVKKGARKAVPKTSASLTSRKAASTKRAAASKRSVRKKAPTAKKASSRTSRKPAGLLKGISDIRRFFHRNETPLYFISATNFNLLGADEWIKGFKFITYIDCFDGMHPNLMSPKTEEPHEEFQSIEDINNYLLTHSEVRDYIEQRRTKGKNGKALFLMFDEKTEALAKKAGLEVIFPKAKLRTWLDNKVNTNRVAEKAGVPCVPYVLSPVRHYEHLLAVAQKGKLGSDLVVQTPFGDSGHTTFFIKSEADYDKYAKEIEAEKECKIMKRINCRGAAM